MNKANQYAEEEKFDKVKELMGKSFDLKTLYPNREVFHVSEFMALQDIAVRYYLGMDDFDQAEKRIKVMEEVDSESIKVEIVHQYYSYALIKKAQKRMGKDEKMKIEPENKFSTEAFKTPEFNFKETYELFVFGLDIPEETLTQFLTFDRKQVIADLENVLKQSFYNYTLGKDYEEHEAPVHTLFLLGELEAEESLPVVLKMMEQTEAYFDYAFDDIFTEYGWIPLFKLAKNQLPLLEDYLKQAGMHTFFRTTVTDALMQIVYYIPEKKDEVLSIYQSLLTFYNQVEIEDNIIDNEFNGLLVADLIDLGLDQFLPEIEKLYEKGYVHPTVCGPYKDVEFSMAQEHTTELSKRELMSINEVYEALLQPNDFEIPADYSQKNEPVQRERINDTMFEYAHFRFVLRCTTSISSCMMSPHYICISMAF